MSIELDDKVYMSEIMSVQSTTLALQNKVDSVRNEDIIRSTAIGTAYSKWISSPALSAQYKEMIAEMSKEACDEYCVSESTLGDNEQSANSGSNANSTVGSALMMVQKNQEFYGSSKVDDDTNG